MVEGGFGASPSGRRNNRRITSPDLNGDGTLRFQAPADVRFDRADALGLTDLIGVTLTYLGERVPSRR